ncbi:hypothetical protein ACIQGA_31270 [[Kitasatospora] papulosa]|jgi:hypothetical protein
MLAGLLKQQAEGPGRLVGALVPLVQQFCEPFVDHPDHPWYEQPEEK